jgi:integrase
VYADSGYVPVDELGRAPLPDWLRRRAYELMAKTGVRRVRLYDARHSALTYLATTGVPDVVLARWAGHAEGAPSLSASTSTRHRPLEGGGRTVRHAVRLNNSTTVRDGL